MKLYVAKLRYKDGDRAHPWTVFADSYASAVARLEKADLFDEIIVREVAAKDAVFYGRDLNAPDQAAIEHSDILWTKSD